MAAEQKFYGQAEYVKGLDGVIACESTIGYVDGQKGMLNYRGYKIEDLAEHSTYEETAYLLIFGKLPTQAELASFKSKLVGYRNIPRGVIEVLKSIPKDTHPMSALRTGVSALGCFEKKAEDTSVENSREIGIKLVAQVATIAGAVARIRQSKEPVAPDPKMDHTLNFLYMATGAKADDFTARVMDISMILHADHGMNASTFTSMVVSSSLSDMYSAVTAGIGSLKGPLHGGANEKVIEILLGIKDPDKTEAWVENALATKQKLMGFGHRVYKAYDPRARILGRYSKEVTALHNTKQLYEIATRMEKKVIDAKGESGIFPNVDFYSGTIYYSLGYEPALFTPIFAVSRVAGWVARVLEYLPENRIFRPRALYKGPLEVAYVPMEKRA